MLFRKFTPKEIEEFEIAKKVPLAPFRLRPDLQNETVDAKVKHSDTPRPGQS